MKVLILAAGRGERMRPLTDQVPKPLLKAGGKSLIQHLVESLVRAGLTDLVLNHAHLGGQIISTLGDGREFGADITYSAEPEGALETGGGILHALPKLDSDPFAVVNGDIWTDYPFERLPRQIAGLAHLVLVDNPVHHPHGDFLLTDRGRLIPDNQAKDGDVRLTFSGIGVYRHALFDGLKLSRFPLAPLLRSAVARGSVSAEHYAGRWRDIGTPERLADLDRELDST